MATILLDIDLWQQQTADLSAELYGAYFEACVWQASKGTLPASLDACAEIMRLGGVDRIATASEVLRRFFLQHPDGVWEAIDSPIALQSQESRLATAEGEVNHG